MGSSLISQVSFIFSCFPGSLPTLPVDGRKGAAGKARATSGGINRDRWLDNVAAGTYVP